MKLEYNGVPLSVVRVVQHTATPEYDQETGLSYLWTRVRLTVEAVYSPAVTALGHKFVTARGTAQEATEAVLARTGSAPLTDLALRHRLSQPRKLLKVWFDSNIDAPGVTAADTAEVWLESPGFDPGGPTPDVRLPCDLAGGPWVHDLSVAEFHGNGRTFRVQATFETCVSDCKPDGGTVPCLANNWTAVLSYDRDGYCTRRFVGAAVFRRDLLEQRDFTPDAFRLDILPPPPRNTVRTVDKLLQSADGLTFAYEVTDEEVPVTYLDKPQRANGTYPGPLAGGVWGAGDAPDPNGPPGTRRPREVRTIRCEVVREYQSKGAGSFIRAAVNTVGAFADRLNSVTAINPQAAGTFELQFARDALAEVETALPQYVEQVTCYVRGTRRARKTELLALAYSTALAQLTTPLGAPLVATLLSQSQYPNSAASSGLPNYNPTTVYTNIFNALARLFAPATTMRVRFDAFDRWVEVTLGQQYGGLTDWVTGGLAGGFKAVVSPIPDDVIGSDWPTLFLTAQGLQAGNVTSLINGTLGAYPLPDAGLKIGAGKVFADQTTEFGPGLQPPVKNDRMGTNLAELVAASLSQSCTPPYQYRGDRVELPNTALPRPTLPVPGGGLTSG